MESNSDKVMRDKLQGVEMPFDPAAWEQMEAMLNKEEKKRGFFWWWFGAGMAGLLLLSGAGAYLATSKGVHGNEQIAVNTTNSEKANAKGKSAGSNGENAAGNEQNAIGNNGETGSVQATIGNEQLNAVNNNTENTLATTTDTNPKQKANKHTQTNTTGNASKKKHSNLGGSSAIQSVGATIGGNTVASAKARSKTNEAVLTDYQKPKTENQKQGSKNSAVLTDFNGKQVASVPVAAKPETVTADKYWLTYLNPNAEDYNPTRSEDNDELPKKPRAKLFQYSMGVIGNISAGIVKQSLPSDTSTRKGFTAAPSYSIGFTHDFLFANRFAISNSILYSQSNFTVSDVRSESFTPAPLSFNCRITEVAIPIGIKVYPVAKPKIRFYLSAGVINHIKISETFSYAVSKEDTTIPNYAADVKNTYPTETEFTGIGNGAVTTVDNLTALPSAPTTVMVNTDEFAINGIKRYYVSFYAGAGLEGIIKNKWILFAEPTFSMDLQKIGIQERRKYNVGANLGFRYQF